ncbi:LUD domain-containing protein [Thermogemmatispora sp.]|uniref:LUD domain-containing protein n=1 Tax=Thermogemmatispora sp. TaxID=1968838 RepID=UPI00257E04B3|nr:LUD domain-containing protein [Thermogemmatispora sp.]
MSNKEHAQANEAQTPTSRPGTARPVPAVHDMPPFAERLQRGLEDENMHRALERFAPSWRQSRQALFEATAAEYGSDYSFVSLRQRLRAAKDEAIAHQQELVARFKEQATAAGAVVYEARSAEDANRYIYELCRRKGITLIVKSKTMVSEEIELNHYLEERGIKAVETDLGEWVAQLDHERPSHMVMPIIHKTRQQVGEVLSRATGREISRENVAEQVAVIRREHRQAFLTAGMGISGANALIAESGTVMLNTNEGNGRMVTSLPPVHVVLAGYDKLLPTFADAMTQIRLLARSATGQPMTSYTTFITGPDRPGKEVHIVLLDNGRSAMRADPRFKEALRCIRCAACANICPPYQQVGGHAFGYIYSGAIGLVVTPFHHGLEAAAGPQSLCVSCNACETVCPVEIPLPSLILDVRSRVVASEGLPWLKRLIFGVLARPRLFDLLTRLAAVGQWPATRGTPYVRYRYLRPFEGLPGLRPLAQLTRWRSLPAFARRPLRDRIGVRANLAATHQEGRRSDEMTVCYFAGCMTDRLYPEMGEAVIQVLERCGLRVVFPRAQHCCGLPALNSGDRQHGVAMAKQTVRMLERALDESGADYIVCASTSCVVTIIQDYLRLFEDLQLQSWLNRTRSLAGRIMDFTSFLLRVLVAQQRLPTLRRLRPGETAPVVTYHDSCQSCNCLGLRTEARQVIRDVLGLELREMRDSDVCCGFGGSTSIEHPEIAERLLERKLRHAEETGATLLVSDNPGCLMHLRGGVDANGRPLRVLHLAQLVAEYLA